MKYKRYRTNIGPGSPAVVVNVKLGKYENSVDFNKAFINKTVDITLRDDLRIHAYVEEDWSNNHYGAKNVKSSTVMYFPELGCSWHGYGSPDVHWWVTPAPFNVNRLWEALNAG